MSSHVKLCFVNNAMTLLDLLSAMLCYFFLVCYEKQGLGFWVSLESFPCTFYVK